ncbi:hypothetical protein PHYBLDRAFT_62576 [Phycomyces blakesleeanus NRRL 1555(-)]|uniref:Uncharacterized protein n=1 Tax=Phycomyces blakesleeanus (strain ATCC 8743b / DSM 1359 / FGSC 10004 / NBRC 33097 / NRRL 1555) TaxID=763407 RepID=A0A163EHI7_PHYB8|nr:hypothetical protein PHYBLDRAFT_62576 [Phycomyces blakesleeanus NRRL 1555(-)]OAD78670.1 hypothetical protein PHYBLDRAFT_62576 [Phycomyces blakesleeanus NRRL 1555(-)]|eukprot:XP_018296710.1 hypothetical protein PHYBLDRAFT_62576 [Phycomyces blakesleeanus NRRL 1555(-)]
MVGCLCGANVQLGDKTMSTGSFLQLHRYFEVHCDEQYKKHLWIRSTVSLLCRIFVKPLISYKAFFIEITLVCCLELEQVSNVLGNRFIAIVPMVSQGASVALFNMFGKESPVTASYLRPKSATILLTAMNWTL